MLVTISPAKKLNTTPIETPEVTQPRLMSHTEELLTVVKAYGPADLKALMKISDALAQLNVDRFSHFGTQGKKQAAYIFDGDTYTGLDADTLSQDAVRWAQDHLRILSGLYGVLRPLDEIEPYRLEMGSRVTSERGTNLYAFWKGHIAPLLAQDAAQAQTDTLVNCASEEYFGAVDQAALGLTIITPKFYDIKNGTPKIVSFWAKKARGAMARYIVEHRLTNPKDLIDFDTGGYAYDRDLSTPTAPAFVRNPDS